MFPRRRLERAWKMGSELIERTGEVALTPWDALLIEVRRSAYHVEWIGTRLNEAITRHKEIKHEASHTDPEYKESMREMRSWLTESRRERRHLAVVSKAAIDAGIANTLVQKVELEGKALLRVFGRVMDALTLDDEQREVATQALRAAIGADVEIGGAPTDADTLDGEVVEDDGPLDDGEPPAPPTFRNPGDFL